MKGKNHTAESRKKISESNKGQVPWIKGKKHRNESKRKISAANKGRVPWNKGKYGYTRKPFSEETRERMSIAAKKVRHLPMSEETKRKLSEANKGQIPWLKGRKHKKESIEKMKGRIVSDATREAISKAKRGKPNFANRGKRRSLETREKIRIARLKQILPVQDTKIEVAMQNELTKRSISFIPHKTVLCFHQCDIFIKPNIVVECDGIHWHAFPEKYNPSDIIGKGRTAQDVWDRDERINRRLKDAGYIVLRYWEHEINEDVGRCVTEIEGVR